MSEENKGTSMAIVIGAIIIGIFYFFGSISSTSYVVEINKTVQDVAIQDQHTEIIDLKLMEIVSNLTLLDNYGIGERYINVSTSIAPIVGNIVCLKDRDGAAFFQSEILTVNSLGGNNYELFLDMPIDSDFSIDDGCSHGTTNWAVDGSITPRTFKVSPNLLKNDTSWDITRILFECSGTGMTTPGDATPDLTAFFVMDPITNGIYLRSTNGITKNIFNAKDNGDIVLRMYDLVINTALNKNGLYVAYARRTFNGQDKNGVTIRLDAITGDTFELIVQDDLTDMTKCQAVVQGHVVDD